MAPDFGRIPRQRLAELLRAMPKAELHLHIEGTLEPELIFELAQKNGVALAYPSVDALRAAYAFTDLQSFLDIYYAGASVLLHESDFEAMAMAYFRRAAADHVVPRRGLLRSADAHRARRADRDRRPRPRRGLRAGPARARRDERADPVLPAPPERRRGDATLDDALPWR
jgi:adenosine deaminase